MDNLELWGKWSTVPKEAQKPITGGRLSGFTDINPVWRYKVLTDAFGPCGTGWKYTINRLWHEPVSNEILSFAEVFLYYKTENGEWSDPIPGIGGSKLAQEERGGVRSNDEGYKMAITDALSVACKSLGIGADIYWAAGGDSKYPTVSDTTGEDKKATTPDTSSKKATPPKSVTPIKVTSNKSRRDRLKDIQTRHKITDDELLMLRTIVIEMNVVPDKNSKQYTDSEFDAFVGALETEAQAYAEERENGNPGR